ncbi:MAG: FKBP-type peptidyl-prolyl cis-trans isomerase [Bacteroidaceae bacterium]|nr:FKBP-type peptidyl-prolyl cis-trans isomerase [Bacteroidaceae bacterium]
MAEINPSKTIVVSYDMYTEFEGERELVEQATAEQPFQFTTGLGFTFEAFEEKFKDLKEGDTFNFTLAKEETNGDRREDLVFDVDKQIFCVNGKFDDKQIYPGNVIPLMNADGQRMNGLVVEVKDEAVTIDLNHPYAGMGLAFEGKVLSMHDATKEEIQALINIITGQGGCSCGCDSCGGGCDGCGDHDGGCDCGHCH